MEIYRMFRRLHDIRLLSFMLSVNNYIYKDKSLLPCSYIWRMKLCTIYVQYVTVYNIKIPSESISFLRNDFYTKCTKVVIGTLERLQNRMIQGGTKQLGTVHPKSWVHIHYIDWLLGACAYSSGNINMDLIKIYTAFNKQHMCICTVHYNH